MNRSDWLTDELIQVAFERRAGRAAPGDLRETIVTLSAASSQRSRWRLQFRSTAPTRVVRSAWLKGVAAATVIGVIAVGAALFVTRPDQPAIGGPSPTPNLTSSPSTPASPSADPSVAVVPPRAPAWTATGAMAKPLFGHKATLLPDGRVLVVEDFVDPTGRLMRAELYDPGTGTWASTASMVAPRSSYSATSLADGKVLVAGGADNSGALASAEVYDPVSGMWTATGAMATDRAYHTATLLTDGKVLVASGAQDGVRGGPFAELYDPISGTWTAAGNMITPTPLLSHTATLLPDGRVLVAGGTVHGDDPLASAELYDPQSGAWSAIQGMVAARSGHTATLLPDGRVLVAGGTGSADTSASGLHEPLASAELFDPAAGTWSATASMNESRHAHTATLLPDGRVLVAGGIGFRSPPGSVDLASAELYDPGSGN